MLEKLPQSPNDERDSITGRVREAPHYLKTDTSTGGVRETALPTNDKIDSSTGHIRQTPHPPNVETDFSKGRVKETPHPPNDEIEQTYRFPQEEKLSSNPRLDRY